MDLTQRQYELLEVLEKGASPDSWHDEGNLYELGILIADQVLRSRIFTAARKGGPARDDLLTAIAEVKKRRNGHGNSLPPPESLTALLAADIPAPVHLFEHLMHEGLLLFGGKSKRGKSWLMFDLALSLAVGRSAFRHYPCPQPRPVLYLALEDGRARLQGRARAIQPNLTSANDFHLRYTFRPLLDGGIEDLTHEIEQYHYGLVVIDVLAKLEPTNSGKGEKNYHDVYEMFAPIQALRQRHPFCLAMLTHLRKQDAEDIFDSLHGSVAYQGAQDVLWVLERKPKDEFAFLHIRDKDAEDTTIALRFLDGHWEYIGEGEEYEVSRDQRKIIRVLSEERKEMSIADLMKAADFGPEKYAYVRKMLMMMVQDDLIHRTKRGHYSVTLRGSIEMSDGLDDPQDRDERGDRVPF
jgi:predicted transcriptional regulator